VTSTAPQALTQLEADRNKLIGIERWIGTNDEREKLAGHGRWRSGSMDPTSAQEPMCPSAAAPGILAGARATTCATMARCNRRTSARCLAPHPRPRSIEPSRFTLASPC
jgi:hypothetical protein